MVSLRLCFLKTATTGCLALTLISEGRRQETGIFGGEREPAHLSCNCSHTQAAVRGKLLMGRHPRRKQKHLAEKLLKVRLALGLSQNEMLRQLGAEEELLRGSISNYELGDREPPLFILLGYARLAGVCLDVLVDDELDLPAKLPAKPKHARH